MPNLEGGRLSAPRAIPATIASAKMAGPGAPERELLELLRPLGLESWARAFADEELTVELLRTMRADLRAESFVEIGLAPGDADRLSAVLSGADGAPPASEPAPTPTASAPKALKLLVEYAPPGVPAERHHRLAITLPPRLVRGSVDALRELFVEAYNRKFGASGGLAGAQLVLQIDETSAFARAAVRTLSSADTPAVALAHRPTVRVVPRDAAHGPPTEARASSGAEASLRCQNYGCPCTFTPATNHARACRHHASAPAFHDGAKWWPCCSSRRLLTFDELMRVPGCRVGAHAAEGPSAGPSVPADDHADGRADAAGVSVGEAVPEAAGLASSSTGGLDSATFWRRVGDESAETVTDVAEAVSNNASGAVAPPVATDEWARAAFAESARRRAAEAAAHAPRPPPEWDVPGEMRRGFLSEGFDPDRPLSNAAARKRDASEAAESARRAAIAAKARDLPFLQRGGGAPAATPSAAPAGEPAQLREQLRYRMDPMPAPAAPPDAPSAGAREAQRLALDDLGAALKATRVGGGSSAPNP